MLSIIQTIITLLFSGSQLTTRLVVENIALKQQLAVMQRTVKRPRFNNSDRFFWVLLFRFWKGWKDTLVIVKPETVVKWHKKGFRLFGAFKSRKKNPGRKIIAPEIRNLVLKMANSNPLWGAPEIHGELFKLGIDMV